MTEMAKIRKRDGRVTAFDETKITAAIRAVMTEKHEPERLTKIVLTILKKAINGDIPTVEQIQNLVEQVLMAGGHYEAAKAYILYREKHHAVRQAKAIIGVTDDLGLSLNQLKVIDNRYLRHDDSGKTVETPRQLFERVARFVAQNEPSAKQSHWQKAFFEVISKMEFMPAGCYLRSAGTKKPSLANCFVLPVEDDMGKIFDAVKWLALVQQRGGGCVAGDSQVFTSFCGLEKISTVYERLKQGRMEIQGVQNGWQVDIADLNINTLAFDQDSGRMMADKILSIWRYQLPQERVYSVKAEGGLEVVTSDWHPFFIFEEGIVKEKRADEIKTGDLLVGSSLSAADQWLFKQSKTIDGRQINEDIGWLVGYVLGDGSFGRVKANTKAKKYYERLRLFDGRKDTLFKAQEIIANLIGKEIKIQKDGRCQTFILTVVDQQLVKWLKKLAGINGPKTDQLKIAPEMIKNRKNVVLALIAGLLDADGYVAKTRQRVTFDSESGILIEQITCLLNIFGIRTRVRRKKPKNKQWRTMFELAIDGGEQLERINNLLGEYLSDEFKKQRLINHITQNKINVDQRSPLCFDQLKPFLIKAGVPVNKVTIHRQAINIGSNSFWLQRLKWGSHISRAQILRVLAALLSLKFWTKAERQQLIFWQLVHQSFRKVVRVSYGEKTAEFFDFTTQKHNNYLAGQGGLTVVHNTGFNFSKLRPKGDYVKKSGGFATGPVSFMKVFDAATGQVMQGGFRMGANMGILNVDHPDILEFITCKTEQGEITNFNISVGATDEFMTAVKKNQRFSLKNPRTGEVVQTLPAQQLFDQIVGLAWRTGDPGMIFLDQINKYNPVIKTLGPLLATNPCGEQPLHPFDVCNLGSINLVKFVKLSAKGRHEVDWSRLEQVTKTAVRFLDNGIDVSGYPLPQIEAMAKANRRIGLGIMGWADMLYQLGVAYNSNEGVKLAEKVMKAVNDAAVNESTALAREKGIFKNWKGSVYEKKGIRRRNLAVTTIAPTGTIAMVAGCSSGIEPEFALSFVKNVVDEAGLTYVNEHFRRAVETSKLSDFKKKSVLEEVAKSGSCQQIEYLPDSIRKTFVSAFDIIPEWHVRMQAAFQKHTENAVSKTINFPQNATIEDVEKAYLLAWELGCKGITIYRSGSKDAQILSTVPKKTTQTIQSKVRITPLKNKLDKTCPECGSQMEVIEGCATCKHCGFSKCSL